MLVRWVDDVACPADHVILVAFSGQGALRWAIRHLVRLWCRTMISIRGPRGVPLLATLFGVIFAVFVLHGLTSHEQAHSEHAATVLAMDTAAHNHAGAGHGFDSETPEPESPAPSPDHDGGSGGLCLALLCLLATLIVLALRRGIPRRVLCVVLRWAESRTFSSARAADPPCLHRLSILRC